MRSFVKVSYEGRNDMDVEIIKSNYELLKNDYDLFVSNFDDKEYIEEFGYFEEDRVGVFVEGRDEEESYMYIDSCEHLEFVNNIKKLLDEKNFEEIEKELKKFE